MFGRERQGNGSRSEPQVYLEREGERRIARILDTVDRVPWSVNLLQLAWTAGPVTYIAAQGGYYIGYKDFLPYDRLIFFVGYTVIAGAIGLFTKITYDAYRSRVQERRQRQLTTAIDRLPAMIFAIRDLAVAALPVEMRQREAAWLLLRKAQLGPLALATAVLDLTGSERLADTVRRVAIYHGGGMQRRGHELLEEEAERIGLVVEGLRQEAPAMAATLRDCLEGRGPTVKSGVPREDNFIERIFAAIEEENPALLTLRDVEEILVLAFELISGREIPMLVFSYRGPWRLERATDSLERARTRYRIGQAMGYSRLKALVTYLTESDTEMAEAVAGQSQAVLLEKAHQGCEGLCAAIYDLRVAVVGGRVTLLDELEEKTRILATALDLYRATQKAYREVGRRHAALIRARERWEELTAPHPRSVTLRTGRGRSGLRIAERTIRLSDEEKLEVAEAIAGPLCGIDLRRDGQRAGPAQRRRLRPLTPESARDLAIDVALILEDFVQISRPEIQRAINSSNACLLSGLEPGVGAATKAAVGAAIANAVQTDLGRAAERLASALVRHYRVRLGEEAIAFLHRTYGADLQTLTVLANYSDPGPAPPANQLYRPPPAIPPLQERWVRQYRRARRLLESHERSMD